MTAVIWDISFTGASSAAEVAAYSKHLLVAVLDFKCRSNAFTELLDLIQNVIRVITVCYKSYLSQFYHFMDIFIKQSSLGLVGRSLQLSQVCFFLSLMSDLVL